MLFPNITEFFLIRRAETMINGLAAEDFIKFIKVSRDTIDTIVNRTSSEVHVVNIDVYMKNIEMAQMMCFLDAMSVAKAYVHLAIDVVERDLATMTHAYIMTNRIIARGNIGTLDVLPMDILYTICDMVLDGI